MTPIDLDTLHHRMVSQTRNDAPQNVELGFWIFNSCMSWGDDLTLWKHPDTYDSEPSPLAVDNSLFLGRIMIPRRRSRPIPIAAATLWVCLMFAMIDARPTLLPRETFNGVRVSLLLLLCRVYG